MKWVVVAVLALSLLPPLPAGISTVLLVTWVFMAFIVGLYIAFYVSYKMGYL